MSDLKRPLLALLIAPDLIMRANILNGRKKLTIREGHRDYRVGDLVMLCCHLEPWCVKTAITSVSRLMAGEVLDETCRDDGFRDNADMLVQMRRFYPEIQSTSPVTIIRWETVTGLLVEERS